MKVKAGIIALTLFAVASAAESSSGDLVSHWDSLPDFFVNYYWQPMDFLIVYIWRYIVYITFFILVDMIYCNFLVTSLESTLTTAMESVGAVFAFGDDASDNCKKYFDLWWDTEFYRGSYNDGCPGDTGGLPLETFGVAAGCFKDLSDTS